MQTVTQFATPVTRPLTADAAMPVAQATDMERLALALLGCAEKYEIEAGLVVQITPPLSMEGLAGLAGIGEYSTALLLDYLLSAGVIVQRRQRLLLAQPAALHQLALGAAPA
ncbi:MAG TPA: hypothetical protein VEQ16_03140 [Acidocella sp.]|jgi:hypothetical protein|nr:hypothetical protein [Acidocella sp.]